jgi:hypothetical protein
MGAHLAAFTTLEEQAEVESRFAGMGYLLPAFHKAYWLGLVADVLWQPDRYKWLDKSVQGGKRNAVCGVGSDRGGVAQAGRSLDRQLLPALPCGLQC